MSQDYGGFDDQNGQAYDGATAEEYTEALPEVLYLMQYCAQAFAPTDESEEARAAAFTSWDSVRQWLATNSPDKIREAAEQRDDVGKTALHFACQHVPPMDIIESFLNSAGEVIQWPDSFGWLPIHYACAYGAESVVIKSLAEAFPESKTTVDRKGRTPLHFFLGTLGTQNGDAPDVVILLSNTGAASYPTDEGLLPLHLACAYGRSEETLYVLADAHPQAATTIDNRNRTPLHFVLSNAGRKAAPAAVRLLLDRNPELVNAVNGGQLPLLVLAQYANSGVDRNDDDQMEACQGCLKYILGSRPKPTPEFFSALQRLPNFLQERAVVMKVVQELLNEKIAQRFPTMILLMDAVMIIGIVVAYMFAVTEAITLRAKTDMTDDIAFISTEISQYRRDELWAMVGGMYLGAFYFLVREMFQIISLIALGAFHIYVRDGSNWLNILYIALVVTWATFILLGISSDEVFTIGTSLSVLFLILKLLSYLRTVSIDFAVFAGGVFLVLNRLGAFILCLVILLSAFSRFFNTLFMSSMYCREADPIYCMEECQNDEILKHQLIHEIQCGEYSTTPWCDPVVSILRVFTMLLGEVDEEEFRVEEIGLLGIISFIVFMFLIVILLANVLIAIVADSYKVVQDQRAAQVFWANRLDFIAQMDAVANGPWRRKLRKIFGCRNRKKKGEDVKKVALGQDTWKRMMDLLFDDAEGGLFNLEFYCTIILRLIVVFAVIPSWFLLGLVTFGVLWPPQIRAWFFTSNITKLTEGDREDAQRKTQIKNLRDEIHGLKDELLQELSKDRTQVIQLKSLVAEKKLEIQNEMKHIKRVVTMLFEQQSGM